MGAARHLDAGINHKPPRDAGFSVLEALVAMAVLASALLPLLALQGQFVKTTEALERNEQKLVMQDLAKAHISALNLDQTQAGEIIARYGSIVWRAEPAAGPQPARDAGGFPSRYQVTLYNAEFTINYNSGLTETITMQALGWHTTVSIFDTL